MRAPYHWPLKWQFALALGLVLVSLLVRWGLDEDLAGRFGFLLLFCSLLPLALLVRPGPFLVAAVLGYLSVWLVFVPPRMSLLVGDGRDGIMLTVFGVALAATALTAWLSQREADLRERHQRAALDGARRWKLVTDSAPALIAYIDASMHYRMTNKAYEFWFGRTSEELVGLHMRKLLGDAAFERVRPHAEVALAGHPNDFETEILHTDGSVRFVHAHYVPDLGPHGHVAGFYAMIIDVTQRTRVEQELRRRSEQFESLINSAPLGVYLVDADFRIRQVNPIAGPLFAAIDGGVIGRRLDEAVHAIMSRERAEELTRIFRHTLTTGEPHHAREFAERIGGGDNVQYYDWRVDRLMLPDGRYGVVCYFRDVSDQVSARKELAESELRYRTLFESIDVGFCILELLFDDAGRAVDYRFVEINPAFEKQTGIKDAAGKSIRELVPDIETSWLDLLGNVALTGESNRPVRYSRSMGRWFDVDAFRVGQPEERRVAVLFSDISERKETEEALRESEQRFRIMADSAPALIWVADTAGACTYFNRQWLQFTGRSLEQELGDGWLQGVHPDDLQRCLEVYRKAYAVPEGFRVEYRLRRHDGEYRWLADEGMPRRLSNGTFVGFTGSCIDITERKRSEEALRETDRRKDEFLATLAHELRNPLAAISTATAVVKMASDNADRVRQMAAIIDRQSSQLVRLIDDLLDVSRISRGKVKLEKSKVDLSEIVRQVVADSRDLCEKRGLVLTAVLPEQGIIVDADPVRIAQVVSNLIDNACKFTQAGGHVRASVERDGAHAIVRISDTGIGMERQQLAHVFQMFTQIRELPNDRAGGLGIGLSLAKSIVELHKGTIEARSEGHGKGSEFLVRLKAAAVEVSGDDAIAVAAAPAPGAEAQRIVAADDNPDALDAVALMLRMNGHQVETAANGLEALQKVRAHHPDVALLDIGMPGMDGYEVASRIRRETWGKDILLVALTGWGQARDKQRAHDAGFDLHLTKPVAPEVLERLMAQKRHRAQSVGGGTVL